MEGAQLSALISITRLFPDLPAKAALVLDERGAKVKAMLSVAPQTLETWARLLSRWEEGQTDKDHYGSSSSFRMAYCFHGVHICAFTHNSTK
jgi:hypothetical protein